MKDNYRDFDGKEKVGETIELSLGEKTIPVTISGFFDGKKNYLCQWTWSNRSGWTNDVFAGKTVFRS